MTKLAKFSAEEKAFVRGFAAAAAMMERHETSCELRSIAATEKLLRDAGVDDFDLQALLPILKKMRQRERNRRTKECVTE